MLDMSDCIWSIILWFCWVELATLVSCCCICCSAWCSDLLSVNLAASVSHWVVSRSTTWLMRRRLLHLLDHGILGSRLR
jgi:hypothetical protein